MQDSEYWQAVLSHDRSRDGQFVYAVRSTGIYCRPSCPSRRPRQEQVSFFAAPAEAEQAGFRACRRCQPDKLTPDDPGRAIVEQICRYLEGPLDRLPTLNELSSRFHLSAYHLQRTFTRIVGVSPRQYGAARRLERFKQELKSGETVTAAMLEAGYQSSSSAYGPARRQLGMTPTAYQRGGEAERITYTLAASALGWLLVAATGKGVCAIKLGDDEAALEKSLRSEFAAATIERDGGTLGPWLAVLQDYLNGSHPQINLPLDVRATAFQQRVWQALQAIPYGETRSYREVAEAIGQPRAARAVAQACAHNPTALAVPCHRVVRADGRPGGYRWGMARKEKLLQQEAKHVE
jgi:AraC family transcriptional regulator of adaptative response/methylated-DNA-[protein]-cysteine methyltransferase